MNPDNPPPIRIALPGMCFRYEQITARSEIQFNQVEGLVVGENITFADLKGTLIDFARRMFGQDVRTRFRASYFPFTEPSAEMDVECFLCGGKGCPVCKSSGWLEVLGSGMVHPIVLQNGGYDPKRYSGYAWGMGPERQLMLRYTASNDIRYFWGNDQSFPGAVLVEDWTMKATNFLAKDYIDLDGLSVEEIARKLTLAGLEVDEIKYAGLPMPVYREGERHEFKTSGIGWDREKIVVAEIREVNPHPNADRLTLLDLYDGQQSQVVLTGAPNIFHLKGTGQASQAAQGGVCQGRLDPL